MSTATVAAPIRRPPAYRRNARCPCNSGLRFKACCHPNAFDVAAHSLIAAVIEACREPLPTWGVWAFPNPDDRTVHFCWTDCRKCEPVGCTVTLHPGPRDTAAAALAIRDDAVRQVAAVMKARGLQPAEASRPVGMPTALVMGLVCASLSI